MPHTILGHECRVGPTGVYECNKWSKMDNPLCVSDGGMPQPCTTVIHTAPAPQMGSTSDPGSSRKGLDKEGATVCPVCMHEYDEQNLSECPGCQYPRWACGSCYRHLPSHQKCPDCGTDLTISERMMKLLTWMRLKPWWWMGVTETEGRKEQKNGKTGKHATPPPQQRGHPESTLARSYQKGAETKRTTKLCKRCQSEACSTGDLFCHNCGARCTP